MAFMGGISTGDLLGGLKAAAESTRLRLLVLLEEGELNVKDLTHILAQSQPRISRHLKLLNEAGLIERFREGSWVYFRLADRGAGGSLARQIVGLVDHNDPVLVRDRDRAHAVRQERAEAAQAYFKEHAANWDEIRTLHVADAGVEAAMTKALGSADLGTLVDVGTGTGRILELFAPQLTRGIGIDFNPDMLAYARAKLQAPEFSHCQVRHGDLFDLPFDNGSVDVVVIHQVLHFLDKPGRALIEASRILRAGGKCLIVDFAPHELEFLREAQAHRRLGFSQGQMKQWIEDASLELAHSEDLAPKAGHGQGKLTVSLWLGEKVAGAGGLSTSEEAGRNKLEVTG